MTFSTNQFIAQRQMQGETALNSAMHTVDESEKLKEQAAADALWRMAQSNAMAKVKGFSKLADIANQL